jgi:branched-chain amino acid transport system ATP-binding protein
MTVALQGRNLEKWFGGLHAIRDVSFTIEEGSLIGLIGPNGAGKSTLFNMFTNLYPPDKGTVEFYGKNLAGLTEDQIAHLGLIRTFQTARVFAEMTVLENIMAGAHLSVRGNPFAQTLRMPAVRREEAKIRKKAEALLDLLALSRYSSESATDLPMGSQKLLELARAVMAGPRVLLLDEPAAGLNDSETAELARLITAIRFAGTTIVVVEHNMSLVMGIADYVLVIDAGRLIAEGPPKEIQTNETVIEAYVGRGLDSVLAEAH